jgi:hypothetical protein
MALGYDVKKCVKNAMGKQRLGEELCDAIDSPLSQVTPEAALTAQLTTITHTAPGTPDYALQALTDSGGFGFETADEGHSLLAVVANLQARLAEVEAVLEAHGLVEAN